MEQVDMDLVAAVESRLAALNTSIARLEHELDIRKAAVEAQFRLMKRVAELEKALQSYVAFSAELAAMIDADKEVKALKLAHSMAGHVTNYRADVDAALNSLMGRESL